jgi:hypothetical protein
MERETGVEPATSTLARSHSTTELLPLQKQLSHYIAMKMQGQTPYIFCLVISSFVPARIPAPR